MMFATLLRKKRTMFMSCAPERKRQNYDGAITSRKFMSTSVLKRHGVREYAMVKFDFDVDKIFMNVRKDLLSCDETEPEDDIHRRNQVEVINTKLLQTQLEPKPQRLVGKASFLIEKFGISSEQFNSANTFLKIADGEVDKIKVMKTRFGVSIRPHSLIDLGRGRWLDDEILNFFFGLLQESDIELSLLQSDRSPSHYFSTFFMNFLLDVGKSEKYKYREVRRWTKDFDIFSRRRIFIPINIDNRHWTLLVVRVKEQEIHYYDSMATNGTNGNKYIQAILQWIVDEANDKKNEKLDVTNFKLFDHGKNIPQQENGNDCGVFVCTFADFETHDLPFTFDQNDVNSRRNRMVYEIMTGNLIR